MAASARERGCGSGTRDDLVILPEPPEVRRMKKDWEGEWGGGVSPSQARQT
ncbi:hypothetical protein VTL71DRAFT_4709 [Oculimacula yallundae]|uniref:Uncharacterized protein n=1 Tax=Oculimacula yallundae TaxID=86028 RepID=A0ABR4C2R0_9HELO